MDLGKILGRTRGIRELDTCCREVWVAWNLNIIQGVSFDIHGLSRFCVFFAHIMKRLIHGLEGIPWCLVLSLSIKHVIPLCVPNIAFNSHLNIVAPLKP